MGFFKKALLIGLSLTVVSCAGPATTPTNGPPTAATPAVSETSAMAKKADFNALVDENGKFTFPKGFETRMTHMGTWFVPAGEASGFHNVYTELETIKYFREHGKFPDGATLVKELRADEKKDYTTGKNVASATTVKQWFVMIKDDSNRFPDNPNWAQGWGWALFKPDDPSKNISTSFKKDCLACHAPAQKTDWVYVDAYPVLHEKSESDDGMKPDPNWRSAARLF